MINLIFTSLVLAAAVIFLATVGLLLMWLKDVDSLAFPGLGLIVAMPLFILLLTVWQLVFVVAAVLVGRFRTGIPTVMSM